MFYVPPPPPYIVGYKRLMLITFRSIGAFENSVYLIYINSLLMLSPRNAQLAVQGMFDRIGTGIKVQSNAIPFNQGYDNYTGGAAAIANFNAIIQPGGGGSKIEKIFYGVVTWGVINDNLGITNHYVSTRFYHDLVGTNYAFTLYYAMTLNSAVRLFSADQGTTGPVLVSNAGLTSKSQVSFDGYLFDIG